MNPTIGIVGTSGIAKDRMLDLQTCKVIYTRYGEVSVFLGELRGIDVAFISRSGFRHPLEPGKVNYRANMLAFRELGIQRVIGSSVVGSLSSDFQPGMLITPDQFLDFTRHRSPTLFDEYGFAFTDMTNPYCQYIREIVHKSAELCNFPLIQEGCYVGVDGPRYETAAEIRMYAMLGGHIIGHTGVTEAIMAREAGLCYASIALITNLGAGISNTPISNEEVTRVRQKNALKLEQLIMATIQQLIEQQAWTCICPHQPVDLQIPTWHMPHTNH